VPVEKRLCWSAWFTVEDEVAVYCSDCDEREFCKPS